jgi:hypothetical protein
MVVRMGMLVVMTVFMIVVVSMRMLRLVTIIVVVRMGMLVLLLSTLPRLQMVVRMIVIRGVGHCQVTSCFSLQFHSMGQCIQIRPVGQILAHVVQMVERLAK